MELDPRLSQWLIEGGGGYLTGAYYTTHFKGERWSSIRRRPGGEATMVDWERSEVAMLDGEGRAELYSLLMFRKADEFNHGMFSNWWCLAAKLSTI